MSSYKNTLKHYINNIFMNIYSYIHNWSIKVKKSRKHIFPNISRHASFSWNSSPASGMQSTTPWHVIPASTLLPRAAFPVLPALDEKCSLSAGFHRGSACSIYQAAVMPSTALLGLQEALITSSALADLTKGLLPHECTAQKPTAGS